MTGQCGGRRLKLQRLLTRLVDPDTGIEFVRMLITVYDADGRVAHQLPAIERGGNYICLPRGAYTAKMDYYRPRSKPELQIPALRTNFQGKRGGSILIHPANHPGQLEGCVAPGLTETIHGVGHSKEALETIFEALGGFVLGEYFELLVD